MLDDGILAGDHILNNDDRLVIAKLEMDKLWINLGNSRQTYYMMAHKKVAIKKELNFIAIT